MQTTPSRPVLGLAGRLMWMMIGPLALVLVAYSIVTTGSGWLTGMDLAFLAILGLMLLGRWLEFQAGAPQTADGEPATPGHLQRYLVLATGTGLGVWVVANLLGNYWLAG
jgi:hypothetical protein